MPDLIREQSVDVTVTVNRKVIHETVEPRKLLSDFLREDCGLTGTHVGCEHGVCGACTVLVNGAAVRSCLLFAVQADGCEITTVEGLSSLRTGRALQQAFSECHALQCAFCTPGILASATEYLDLHGSLERRHIEEMLSGHLCRCTGYKGIIDAIETAARRLKEDGE
ncbi:MAG TPA: (2Fe-2S)-binding protein [Alicyclobacillus sp.]|nr:(2Fe-2S)-binding protein [Alicyclobacillus sp.]